MSKFSVKKPLTVFVAVVIIIVLGIVSYTRMTPDLMPNIDLPYVLVTTPYPGASPEDVEREVSKPLEQAMATLDDIETVSSVSNENYSMLILQFADGSNLDTVTVDILQKINTVSGGWDDMVSTPTILKINPNMLPVSIVAVDMEDMDTAALSEFVNDTLLNKLEGINGVASVDADGLLAEKITVELSPDKLDALNVRIRAALDDTIDEALDDLNETKQDLIDSKAEIEDNLAEVKEGKEALEEAKDKLDEVAGLSGTLAQAQAEATSGKQLIQVEIAALEMALDAFDPMIEAVWELEGTVNELDAASAQLFNDLDALAETLGLNELRAEMENRRAENSAALAEYAQRLWDALEGMIAEAEAALAMAPDVGELQAALAAMPDLAELQAALEVLPEGEERQATLEMIAQIEQIQAALEMAGQFEELQASYNQLVGIREALLAIRAQVTAVEASYTSLTASIAGMGIDPGESISIPDIAAGLEDAKWNVAEELAKARGTLAQIEAGSKTIAEGMAELESGKLTGILEMAEANSGIVVGEILMEQGLEQIDSGLEQIEEGFESIEEARQDAYKNANAHDFITMSMVSQILVAQNFSMPAGTVEEDGESILVSVGDALTSYDELESLVLFDLGSMGIDGIDPIMLTDVATVGWVDNADSIYANINGNNGVLLSFSKQSNYATAEVSDNINAAFADLEAQYPGLKFTNLMDQGDYIYMVVWAVIQNLLFGAALAVVVLFIFLKDIRPTFATLASIPISVLFAFILMYFSGVSINMFSLSGLAVAVGMLVDNSVVVIENIYRLRAKGVSAIQAAVSGAHQVGGAIAASTLTTVAIFMPIVFIEGITRQLFTDFALTFAYALIASLVIALTVVPSMASRLLKGEMKEQKQPVMDRVYRVYERTLRWVLNHKLPVLAGVLALLIASAGIVLVQGYSFMPDMDMGQLTVTVQMPEGSTREDTAALSDVAVDRFVGIDGVETVGAMISGGLLSGGGDDTVTMYVLLEDGATTKAVAEEIDRLSADLDAEITSSASSGMDITALGGSGVSITLYGDDMDAMQEAATAVAARLAEVEGIKNVDDGIDDTSPAIRFVVDKEKAMEHGLTVAQVYVAISEALTTETTSTSITTSDGESYDVLVTDGTAEELTPAYIRSYELKTTNSDGDEVMVPIGSIAEIVDTQSMNSIRRTEGQRYMTISAEVEDDYNVTLVTQDAERHFADFELTGGMRIEFGGENETIMEAMYELVLMLLLGILLVYLIMVAQFQSLKSPFIVMFTIPLAFTGGFLALLITGNELSVISLIGFVMLVGIIVNNGIVLVDYINQLRAEGVKTRDAIIESGVTRMRPILMTSITTIFGLLTMAIGVGTGTDIMQPIAVVCIGGLLYATLLTLYVVPAIYEMLNRKDFNAIDESELEIIDD